MRRSRNASVIIQGNVTGAGVLRSRPGHESTPRQGAHADDYCGRGGRSFTTQSIIKLVANQPASTAFVPLPTPPSLTACDAHLTDLTTAVSRPDACPVQTLGRCKRLSRTNAFGYGRPAFPGLGVPRSLGAFEAAPRRPSTLLRRPAARHADHRQVGDGPSECRKGRGGGWPRRCPGAQGHLRGGGRHHHGDPAGTHRRPGPASQPRAA
jgi:hypothetical protein